MSRTCVSPSRHPQVQLCETRRELQELKASLRVAQKEKEQLLMEKQVSVAVWSLHTAKDEKKTPQAFRAAQWAQTRAADHLSHVDSLCVLIWATPKLGNFDV